MSNFKTFEDLEVWKKAHLAVMEIYRMTNSDLLSKDYALKDQMRRSAISITSNIAEGHERKSNKEFVYFLNVAKASSAELRSQLILARDLKYISYVDHVLTKNSLVEVNKMIWGLMKYLAVKN